MLLDLNALGKDHKFVGLGGFEVSDDHNLLAYTMDFTGFRQYALQVKDLRNGQTLPDTTDRVTSMAWAADNKTLFLTTEDDVTKRSDKLFRHVLGAPTFDLLYDEKDELYDIGVGKTRDQKYLDPRDRFQGHQRNALPVGRAARRTISPSSCRAKRSTGITSIIAKARSTSAPTRAASTSPS